MHCVLAMAYFTGSGHGVYYLLPPKQDISGAYFCKKLYLLIGSLSLRLFWSFLTDFNAFEM